MRTGGLRQPLATYVLGGEGDAETSGAAAKALNWMKVARPITSLAWAQFHDWDWAGAKKNSGGPSR
jgi:hypothetical protein